MLRRLIRWLFAVAFMALYGVCSLVCFVLVFSSIALDEPVASIGFFVMAASCACVAHWIGQAEGE